MKFPIFNLACRQTGFKFSTNILFISLLCVTLPLFFYKLGQSSLVSWDEAWYGEIARNILKSGDFIHLYFNGNPYTDHPPFGFWLIAITYKIFGINEFWTRFAPAVLGFGGVLATYFLGKELFNRKVGFLSALALSSSPWFLYRSRSGNLDSVLTTMFVLTVFLALRSTKNKRFLNLFVLGLGGLFLTKTLVPFTILPVLAVIFWNSKLRLKDFIIPGLLFLAIFLGWLASQNAYKSDFISRYFMIGFPGAEMKSSYFDNLQLFKDYLHNGIGKWFWPGILSIFGGIFLFKKKFFIPALFFVSFAVPFLFSNKGQIWHLLPLHPFMTVAFFGFSYVILDLVQDLFSKMKWIPKQVQNDKKHIVASVLMFSFGLYFSLIQIRQIWYQFIDIPAYVSDEAILSREAGKYTEDFYIDGGDFGPAAVFYSGGKHVTKVWEGGLPELFATKKTFVMITHQWRLDKYNIEKDRYKILKKDRDKILILSHS